MNHISNFDAERALRALDVGKPVSPDHFAAAMALRLDRADDEFQERLEEAQVESFEEGKAEFESPYNAMVRRADALYEALDDEAIPTLRGFLQFFEENTRLAKSVREFKVAQLREAIDKLEGVLFDE